MKLYFKLEVNTWSYDWENTEYYYFKTKSEAESYKKEMSDRYRGNIRFTINELTFDELKESITVSDFEELFGVTVDELY